MSAKTPVGRLTKATKTHRILGIQPDDFIVVINYDAGAKRTASTEAVKETVNIFVTKVPCYALAVQRGVVAAGEITINQQAQMDKALELAGTEAIKKKVDNMALGGIRDQWKKYIHGEGLDPLHFDHLERLPINYMYVGRQKPAVTFFVDDDDDPTHQVTADVTVVAMPGGVVGGQSADLGLRYITETGTTLEEPIDQMQVEEIFSGQDAILRPSMPREIDISQMTNLKVIGAKLVGSCNLNEDGIYVSEVLAMLEVLYPGTFVGGATGVSIGTPQAERKRIAWSGCIRLEADIQLYLAKQGVPLLVLPADLGASANAVSDFLAGMISEARGFAEPPGGARRAWQQTENFANQGHLRKMYMLAEDEGQWNLFRDAAANVVCVPGQGQVLLNFGPALDGAIDRALSHGDASRLSGDSKLNAGQMMDILMCAKEATCGYIMPTTAAHQAAQQAAAAGAGGKTVVTIAAPDTSGSEHEIRTRQHAIAAAQDLLSTPAQVRELAVLAELAKSSDHAALSVALQSASDNIVRLVCVGDDMQKTLHGSVDASVADKVGIIRGGRGRAHERAVTGKDYAVAPTLGKALACVRNADLLGVNLGHLAGHPDFTHSRENPLKGFAECKDSPKALSVLSAAFSTLTQAWCLAMPAHSAQIVTFVARLCAKINEAISDGAGWPALSVWYRDLLRRNDKQTTKFLLREATEYRAPPNPEWIEERDTKYNILLASAISKAQAAAAAKAAMAEVSAKRADDCKKMENQIVELKRSIAKSRTEPKGNHDKPNPKVNKPSSGAASSSEAGKGEWDGKSRDEQRKFLLNTMGMKDGKYPCTIHHTKSKGPCTRTDCRFYH